MTRSETHRLPEQVGERERVYLLAIGAAMLGVGLLVGESYGILPEAVLLVTFGFTTVLAALAAAWGANALESHVVGLVPLYLHAPVVLPLGAGARVELYPDVVDFLLFLAQYALPLATAGFVLGVLWRRETGRFDRTDTWLRTRVGMALVLILLLWALAELGVVNYGGLA